MNQQLRAGVVGLGMIGGGVAVSLARRGRVPVVYDIRPDAAAAFPGAVGSPAEVAAAADVVLVAVVDADQARDVLTGLLTAAHPGMIVVLLSTVAVPVVHEFAAVCAAAGVSLLDCGVTPGDKAAENGMVAILGGDTDVVERARPVLADFAKRVVHCGPLGAGMATKIARNVITYGSWTVVHEATTLARAAGVDPATLVEVIETADPGGATLLSWLRDQIAEHPANRDVVPQVVKLLDKDLAAAEELAGTFGVDVPLVSLARAAGPRTLAYPDQEVS